MAKITYLDKELYNQVRKDADKKFSKDSYVKNMWVLKEYERRGGKTKKSGEKPKNEKIKKQVSGSWELDFDLDTFEVAEEKKKDPTGGRGLNKPFRTPKAGKKFGVFVRNKKGNIILVRFGDNNLSIKRDDPEARKSFMARHKCDTKKDRTTPGFWACWAWRPSTKLPASTIVASLSDENDLEKDWDGETFWDETEILAEFEGIEFEEISEEGI